MSRPSAERSAAFAHLFASELVRLEVRTRAWAGAAHSLNNALTTILGEASFLLAERKDDPELVDVAEAIQIEATRCSRLLHRLTAHPPELGEPEREVELTRLVRDLAPLLRDTLGRGIELRLDLPESLVLVRGLPADIELLVLLVVQRLCEGGAHSGELLLRVDPAAPAAPRLRSRIQPNRKDRPLPAGLLDVEAATSPREAALLAAVAALASQNEIELQESPETDARTLGRSTSLSLLFASAARAAPQRDAPSPPSRSAGRGGRRS